LLTGLVDFPGNVEVCLQGVGHGSQGPKALLGCSVAVAMTVAACTAAADVAKENMTWTTPAPRLEGQIPY
jgi:hypothetical protein